MWRQAINNRGKPLKGYEVSDRGRVRSFWTIGPKSVLADKPHLRKPSTTKPRGQMRYRVVCLRLKRGKQTVLTVHEMVAYAFIGLRPGKKYQIMHLNHRRTDNRVENLAWRTQSEVTLHAITRRPRRPLAKLTPSDVRFIRRANGLMAKDLAWCFGVQPRAIYNVRWRKTWRDVKEKPSTRAPERRAGRK